MSLLPTTRARAHTPTAARGAGERWQRPALALGLRVFWRRIASLLAAFTAGALLVGWQSNGASSLISTPVMVDLSFAPQPSRLPPPPLDKINYQPVILTSTSGSSHRELLSTRWSPLILKFVTYLRAFSFPLR